MAKKDELQANDEFTTPLEIKSRRFSDIMPLEEARPPVISSKNCVNLSYTLLDFTEREMGEQYRKGEMYTKWFLLTCLDEQGEEVFISAGGYVICRQIDAVNKVEDLPMRFTFKLDKDGRTMFLD